VEWIIDGVGTNWDEGSACHLISVGYSTSLGGDMHHTVDENASTGGGSSTE